MHEPTIIALLFGPDRPGIVADAANWIYKRGGNIHHADQHNDRESSIFFQRIEWSSEGNLEHEATAFHTYASNELNMSVQVALSSHKPKVALFVSKIDHCYHDIILRFKAGEFSGELACILSNHNNLRETSERYSIPFHYLPVTKGSKAEAEGKQIEIVKNNGIELIVLARYMQILSKEFLYNLGCPVINIHHSFLPAFTGGNPYRQAYARGVKLIGATAHYATPELDEGPIIHQDVCRINHRNSVQDLVRKGKDLEKSVFAHGIRLHPDNRILIYDNKTVVFY
jgi:formyltetrahydrofolate deformylase